MPEREAFARVAIGDLTLADAAGASEDGNSYWLAYMPVVLDNFPQITLEDYWHRLTVEEHGALVEYLQVSGVLGRKEEPDGRP